MLLAQASENEGTSLLLLLLPLLFLVGIAVIFGGWGANAAERRGYSRRTGWVLGILFGALLGIVVGRLIAAVLLD
jgi:hypothetical protein